MMDNINRQSCVQAWPYVAALLYIMAFFGGFGVIAHITPMRHSGDDVVDAAIMAGAVAYITVIYGVIPVVLGVYTAIMGVRRWKARRQTVQSLVDHASDGGARV